MDNNLITAPISPEPSAATGISCIPLVITPDGAGTDAVEWLNRNKEEFLRNLTFHGCALFRGFDTTTVTQFNRFVQCFDQTPLPYMFRSSPREELDKAIRHIYKSTSYPSERHINLHNESSYSRAWGMKIAFCCIRPADEGGETPLADSRKVLAHISPQLVEKFRRKGVKYRRNLLAGLGMPWQEVFQTDDKDEVERICRRNDIQFDFRGEDLIIQWVKPAVYNHPLSGEATWFNHVLFFNRYSRYEELDLDPDTPLPEEYLSSDTFFGDGSEITYGEYLEIRTAYTANTISFPYRQGDIIFLDNMLMAHGRNPYTGQRVIATAIMEPAYDAGYIL